MGPPSNQQEVVYVTAGSKKLGKNFKRMIPIYEYFSRGWPSLDYSDKSLLQLYDFESRGIGSTDSNNGFANGKKWMDVAIAMWKEDLGSTIHLSDLYDDPDLPDWWLDKVMGPT